MRTTKFFLAPTSAFTDFLSAKLKANLSISPPSPEQSYLETLIGYAHRHLYVSWMLTPLLTLFYHTGLEILRGKKPPTFWRDFLNDPVSLASFESQFEAWLSVKTTLEEEVKRFTPLERMLLTVENAELGQPRYGESLLMNAVVHLHETMLMDETDWYEHIDNLQEVLQWSLPDELLDQGCARVEPYMEGLQALYIYIGEEDDARSYRR